VPRGESEPQDMEVEAEAADLDAIAGLLSIDIDATGS
jgi:hypothetical protein